MRSAARVVSKLSMPDTQNFRVRPATGADLFGMAGVFFAAFPESVRHYTGWSAEVAAEPERLEWRGLRRLMAELFGVCLAAERGSVFVAEDVSQSTIAGYIIAPAQAPGIVREFLRPRHGLRLALALLTGRYRVSAAAVTRGLRNAWHGLRDLRRGDPALACPARILSVAVHPRYHGQGLGQALCQAGLDYLRARGAACVRLEVRPWNASAHHVYSKLGFATRGQTSDSQGLWDIMLLDCTAHPEP
jgi:ribosomal protein S18 acetylase RimI-like enzyme